MSVADTKGSVDKVSGTSYAAPFVAVRLATLPDVRRADAAVGALAARAISARRGAIPSMAMA
jgi:hypothetical protein